MKAAQISSYGGPDVIEINEVNRPEPKEGQVLVEVHSSSVNPFDDKVKAGMMKNMRPLDFPATIGGDISGVIVEGNETFKSGDKIWGSANIFGGGSGAMAEFAAVLPSQLGYMPKTLDFEAAGALPLVGLSATQALIDIIALKEGQRILIQGASGGIGSIAVQLAKHLGAYVYATCGPDSINFVKELGADEVIDYKAEDFRLRVRDVEAVFDNVGGDTNKASYEVLKKDGIIAGMISQPDEELMKRYNVRSVSVGTKTNTESLDRLSKLVDEGVIEALVQKVYPLEETREAFIAFEAGGLKGKVGIRIK